MLQLEAARFELAAVMVPQYGKQYHAVTVGMVHLRRAPVHVEITGVDTGRPVLQDVPPPAVVPGGDGHVVGDHVQDLTKGRLPERPLKFEVAPVPTQLLVDRRRVDHVVTVRAAFGGLQHRRQVDVADAEVGQVAGYGGGVRKAKTRVQLQPVRGTPGSPLAVGTRPSSPRPLVLRARASLVLHARASLVLHNSGLPAFGARAYDERPGRVVPTRLCAPLACRTT